MTNDDHVHVAVAVILNEKNQVLISLRPESSHLGGYWEFPGGKVENNETVEQALFRELQEELDINIETYRPLIQITHRYHEKSVFLDVWLVSSYAGTAIGKEGQEIRWEDISQLDVNDFPEANLPIITAIKLPDRCLITGDFSSEMEFIEKFEAAIKKNIKLIQLRITHEYLVNHGEEKIYKIVQKAQLICEPNNLVLMLNLPDSIKPENPFNMHLNSASLMRLPTKPECQLLSASCHNKEQILKAEALGVDFIFLSPVKATQSHPNAVPIEWDKFSELLFETNMPTYALGGMTDLHITEAWNAGAQGIAGIGAFWG